METLSYIQPFKVNRKAVSAIIWCGIALLSSFEPHTIVTHMHVLSVTSDLQHLKYDSSAGTRV